jgi:N-acetylglucosaminyldiphosphoundecaprenol N-acetyl-beta-D-mannosaminyltransferase
MAGDRTRVRVAGVEVDAVDQATVLDLIEAMVLDGSPHMMIVVNASKLVLAAEDARLRETLERADLVTADGMSVVWAARLLGQRLPGRVTGIDTMELLVARASERGWPVFFLGARQESLDAAVANLLDRHPALQVAGRHHGYISGNEQTVATLVRHSGATLLFVAMGSPGQEQFIARYLDEMRIPFALGVGGSFDHIAGLSRRAPLWMQRAGLEWLYRLASEPRRLWRRYLIGNLRFAWLIASRILGRADS